MRIRQLLWIYFWLLIFEGALRKWILPGLSNPLLLVRDPVALLALWWGLPLLNQCRWRPWLQSLFVIGLTSFVLAITVGHGDIPTAAFGARVLLLQLPLIFLYASVFDRSDVIRFAWALALLSLPMTILLVGQSNLPSTHILNVAPGGVDSAVFSGALDRFRPPGVFSFITGVSFFYSLAASALFLLLYDTNLLRRGRLICLLVAIALVVALPVSISRSLFAGYLQVVLATISALILSRGSSTRLITGLIGLVLGLSIAVNIPAFQDTSDAFVARWEQAAISENSDDARLAGGLAIFQSRVLGGFTQPLSTLDNVRFLGYGIGIGSNVGAQRIGGAMEFLVGEDGWESTLGEMGVPLGLAFLAWRVALAFSMLKQALQSALQGNRLPLILAGSSLLPLVNGQIGQPTNLGFILFSAGLTLAACNAGSPSKTILIRSSNCFPVSQAPPSLKLLSVLSRLASCDAGWKGIALRAKRLFLWGFDLLEWPVLCCRCCG